MLTVALAAAMGAPSLAQNRPLPPGQQPVAPVQQQQTTTTTTTTVNDPDTDVNDPGAMGPNNQYGDPMCGVWSNGVWQANGHCPGYAVGPRRARVAGTITAVQGHLVTLQRASGIIVINDQPALYRETTGRVAVGRQVIAYGYWHDGNFYATALE